tara:strand:- start:521 stop:1042 length:522 start_codon:yes stop_codon:yes gene_type:complete
MGKTKKNKRRKRQKGGWGWPTWKDTTEGATNLFSNVGSKLGIGGTEKISKDCSIVNGKLEEIQEKLKGIEKIPKLLNEAISAIKNISETSSTMSVSKTGAGALETGSEMPNIPVAQETPESKQDTVQDTAQQPLEQPLQEGGRRRRRRRKTSKNKKQRKRKSRKRNNANRKRN